MSSANARLPRELLRSQVSAARLARYRAAAAARCVRGVQLLFEGTSKPANVAAMLRTAENYGVHRIDVTAPARVRVPRALDRRAHLWLSVAHHTTVGEWLAGPGRAGRVLLVGHVDASAAPLHTLAARLVGREVTLAVGGELDGASPELLAAADHRYVLPCRGLTESLNVHAALAASLQTLLLAGVLRADATEAEQEELVDDWVRAYIDR